MWPGPGRSTTVAGCRRAGPDVDDTGAVTGWRPLSAEGESGGEVEPWNPLPGEKRSSRRREASISRVMRGPVREFLLPTPVSGSATVVESYSPTTATVLLLINGGEIVFIKCFRVLTHDHKRWS